jgi:dTDP-4-dehydrorhamnose reductase
MIAGDESRFPSPEVSGTYHMTAAGETTWYEFANVILEEARRAPQNLSWLASVTSGRPLHARRVLPISSEEFHSPIRRPAYSVLSNARLKQAFGVTLPDWRTQLQRCFSPERTAVNPSAVLSSR